MKCSLLTLSTFIDGELAPPRRAEVDAHLVGCPRCTAGAATLREEKGRLGQLARVHIDPQSALLMLEQVGIAVAVLDRTEVVAPRPPDPVDTDRPWRGSDISPSLPWTPQRPAGPPEPLPASPAVSATDVQPDLPLEGVRSVPPSWDVRPGQTAAAAPAAETIRPEPVAPAYPPADLDEWDELPALPPQSWEAAVPPPIPAAPRPPQPDPATAARSPEPPSIESRETPALPPLPPLAATQPPPPTRLAAATGPAALWTRTRDAVMVRLALARGRAAADDSLQIVSGAPLPPVMRAPAEVVTASGHEAPLAPGSAPLADADLDSLPLAAAVGAAVVEDPAPGAAASGPLEPGGWNAFAASSYPDAVEAGDSGDARPATAQRRTLGRHSRAVARDQLPLTTRLSRSVATAAAVLRVGAGSTVGRIRAQVKRIPAAGPDNRLLAGIAGIGLLFVVALLVGHASPHTASTAANRPPVSSSGTHSQTPTPPGSSAAAPSTAGPAQSAPRTYGAGDSGFQVLRLRYGAHVGYMLVVFDLGTSGAATGTPRVAVAMRGPTTVMVTLYGTEPAASTGTPPVGKVIQSVTLVSSGAQTTVYRFTLTHAAAASGLYLSAPTRFVLDLH